MIQVFYCVSYERLDDDSFNCLLDKLPVFFQSQILKFRKWEDRQRSLLAKVLLTEGLKILNVGYSLDQLKYTELKRPYFNDLIDFNISHSGEYILCGISVNNKLGIDVEEIKDIPLTDYQNEFSTKEMDEIFKSEDSLRSFYDLWTKKEAFLKAIGTGLHTPLNKIEINDEKIIWNNENWFLSKIKLDGKYISHICTNTYNPKIVIQQISF